MRKSEKRQHVGLIRCHEETHEDIKRVADAEGLPMATLLDMAWTHYKKTKIEAKACRYCGSATGKDRSSEHSKTCPLYI